MPADLYPSVFLFFRIKMSLPSYHIQGDNMDKSKLKVYGIFVLITEAIGAVAGLLTSLGMSAYEAVEKIRFDKVHYRKDIAWRALQR